MAQTEESSLDTPRPQDMSSHVADYSSFVKMFKWGAVICFIIGMGWMLIVKTYW